MLAHLQDREKPADLMPGDINAGTYVLEPSALRSWPVGENISIERQIFPSLVAGGQPLYGRASSSRRTRHLRIHGRQDTGQRDPSGPRRDGRG